METWILILAAVLSFLFVFLGVLWIGGFFDAFFRPDNPEDPPEAPPSV